MGTGNHVSFRKNGKFRHEPVIFKVTQIEVMFVWPSAITAFFKDCGVCSVITDVLAP